MRASRATRPLLAVPLVDKMHALCAPTLFLGKTAAMATEIVRSNRPCQGQLSLFMAAAIAKTYCHRQGRLSLPRATFTHCEKMAEFEKNTSTALEKGPLPPDGELSSREGGAPAALPRHGTKSFPTRGLRTIHSINTVR